MAKESFVLQWRDQNSGPMTFYHLAGAYCVHCGAQTLYSHSPTVEDIKEAADHETGLLDVVDGLIDAECAGCGRAMAVELYGNHYEDDYLYPELGAEHPKNLNYRDLRDALRDTK